jgi:hypothetical protein
VAVIGRRALALARELGYPAGEALALYDLAAAAVVGVMGGWPGRPSRFRPTFPPGEPGSAAAP